METKFVKVLGSGGIYQRLPLERAVSCWGDRKTINACHAWACQPAGTFTSLSWSHNPVVPPASCLWMPQPSLKVNDLLHPPEEQTRNPQRGPRCWDTSQASWSTWRIARAGAVRWWEGGEMKHPTKSMMLLEHGLSPGERVRKQQHQPKQKQVGSPRCNDDSNAGSKRCLPQGSCVSGLERWAPLCQPTLDAKNTCPHALSQGRLSFTVYL